MLKALCLSMLNDVVDSFKLYFSNKAFIKVVIFTASIVTYKCILKFCMQLNN